MGWSGQRNAFRAGVSKSISDGGILLGIVQLYQASANYTRQLNPRWNLNAGMLYGDNNGYSTRLAPPASQLVYWHRGPESANYPSSECERAVQLVSSGPATHSGRDRAHLDGQQYPILAPVHLGPFPGTVTLMMEEFEEQKATRGLDEYWGIVSRRKWWILGPLFFGWLLVFASAWVLPPTYTSESVILVEEPKVPRQLCRAQRASGPGGASARHEAANPQPYPPARAHRLPETVPEVHGFAR